MAAPRPRMEPAPCAACGQPTSKKCAGCGQVSYCSHACQKRGWKRHKKVCRPPTEMATSEVCKVLVDVMRSPEIRNEPDGNVFIDPRQVNGGVFLGLNGTVVKSHGGADATGVSAAIKLAFTLAESGFAEKLAARVASTAQLAQDAAHVPPKAGE